MPDARELRGRSVGVRHRHGHDVVDARVPEAVGGVGRDGDRITEQPAQDVDVVDRVLDQRAASGRGDVLAPGRSVLPLDREVLVVAQRGRERAAVATGPDELGRAREHRRVAQHQPDLVRHAARARRRRARTPRASARAASRRTPPGPRRPRPTPLRDGPRSTCRPTPRRPRRRAPRATRPVGRRGARRPAPRDRNRCRRWRSARRRPIRRPPAA